MGDKAAITSPPPPLPEAVAGTDGTHRLVVDFDQMPADPLLKSLLRPGLLGKITAARGGLLRAGEVALTTGALCVLIE